jgi:acyl-coenzyme A thioesterase PaaI-like protein
VTPSTVRRLINLWPPLLFSGIRVEKIAPDWRHVEVRLRLRWWNRNAVGTMFGGSLFAMTDPFYPLMLQHNLGPAYAVWTKSAQIEFLAPGRSLARASFDLADDKLAVIRAATQGGAPALAEFSTTITDLSGKPLTQVNKVVYVRLKPPQS